MNLLEKLFGILKNPISTGLSGHSNQSFINMPKIIDVDEDNITVISLRLVSEDRVEDPQPLKCLRNPVPPAIR